MYYLKKMDKIKQVVSLTLRCIEKGCLHQPREKPRERERERKGRQPNRARRKDPTGVSALCLPECNGPGVWTGPWAPLAHGGRREEGTETGGQEGGGEGRGSERPGGTKAHSVAEK